MLMRAWKIISARTRTGRSWARVAQDAPKKGRFEMTVHPASYEHCGVHMLRLPPDQQQRTGAFPDNP